MPHLYKVNHKTRTLVQLALFSAIIIAMGFTPLGIIPGTNITLIHIPVGIGAILLGPGAGLYLGTLFGAVSFIQCFGMNALGVLVLGINPFLTAIMCFVPRMLMGWLCGMIYRGLSRLFKKEGHPVALSVASACSALLNTLFFVTALVLFFGMNPTVQEAFAVDSVIGIIVGLVTINAVFEVIAALVLGTAVSAALLHYLKSSGADRSR